MKKVFSLILALAMVLTFMPMQTYAASGSRTISGTLTFSSPVKEDTWISVYTDYAYGSFWYSGGYQSITAKQGATSVNFSLDMAPDAYVLCFDSDADWFYYGVEDDLTEEWEQRAVFDLNAGSVSGLKVNGDALLGSGSSGGNANVVINFPEAFTKDKRFRIMAGTEDGSGERHNNIKVEAGKKSASVSMSLNLKKKYRFYFTDITNGSMEWVDYTGILYATEGGVSSLESNAKLYTVSAGSTITINYPSCYTISGTLDRTGYANGVEAAAYVVAEFADGERYADRIVFPANTKTDSFKIYIPQSQKGKTYTLYTAPAYGITGTGVMKNKEKSVGNSTLNGNSSAGTVTMESYALSTYSGTVSLPSGITAPSGDVEVRLYSNNKDYVEFGEFTIPAGSGSTSFSFQAEPGLSELTADLCSPVVGAFYTTHVKVSGTSGIKLAFAKEAVISGTVYLPDGVDTAYVGEMYGESNKENYYSYLSIRHGENSSKYYLHVPMGTVLNSLELYRHYDGNERISEDSVYIDSSWQQTSYYRGEIAVNGNKSGVDIHLEGSKIISGRLISSDGDAISITNTEDRPSIRLQSIDTGDSGYYRVDLASNGTWTATVPSSCSGQYYLRFDLDDIESNIVADSYYYADGKVATYSSEATAVNLDAATVSGLDVYVSTGYVLNGSIAIPAGGYFNRITSDTWNPYVSVVLENNDTYHDYYASVQMNPNSKTWNYRIVVPKENGTYTCWVEGNSDILEYFDTNVGITSRTPKVNVAVSGNMTIPTLSFPLVKAKISGTVSRPADIPGSIDLNIYVETDNGSYEASAYFKEKDSADYTILIPDTDDSTTYTLYYYSWSNTLKSGYWYLKNDGTFTQNDAEAATFTIVDRTHDFTPVPIDPFVKGKIYLPESVEEESYVSVSLSSQFETAGGDTYGAYNDFWTYVENTKKDSKGRYIEYVLGDEDITGNGTFYLSYTAENDVLDCSNLYVLADGSVGSAPATQYYLNYNGTTPLILNFTLLSWDDGNRYVFESAHGLEDETVTYTYTYPGECDSLTLTFNDRSNEKVTINGTEYQTADPVTIEGKKAEVTVEFGYNRDNRYGFACTDITASGVTKHKSGVAAVYTPNGDDNEDIIEDLKDTNEISATFSTDGIEAGKKLMGHAALYDKDGRFLGLSKADDFVVDGSNAGMKLTFDEVSEDTVQVTVVVIDTDYKPMGDCMTK